MFGNNKLIPSNSDFVPRNVPCYLAFSDCEPKLFESFGAVHGNLLSGDMEELWKRIRNKTAFCGVRTSMVESYHKLDGDRVILVRTLNSDYLVLNGKVKGVGKPSYLAYAGKVPEKWTSQYCYRFGDSYDTAEMVITSVVIDVVKIGRNLYRVETWNSVYYTCVI